MSDELNHLTDEERAVMRLFDLHNVLGLIEPCRLIVNRVFADLNAARAKLAQLPRTADMVEIVPGMVVYSSPSADVFEAPALAYVENGNGFVRDPSSCYSTREAAIAAKGDAK